MKYAPKTEKLSTDQRMDIFKGIAGQEHFSKLEPLVVATGVLDKNTGQVVNKFKELTAQLENSAGAAKKVADIQMDNLAGDIDQLKGAWESLSIALGGKRRRAQCHPALICARIDRYYQ